MRRFHLVPFVVLLLFVAARAGADEIDCEAVRCQAQNAINTQCSCDGSSNHGRYVSCVAHVIKQLAVPVECKGKVVRCAARSTCGKPGFVACQIPVSTCDLTTSTCADAPTVTCTADIDCGSVCRIKSSAEHCTARNGVPGAGTCCAACATGP